MTPPAFLVFNNGHEYKGKLVPVESTTRLLWNDASISRFQLPDDDPMLDKLVPGESRVQVRFAGNARMEGPVVERAGTGPNGAVTCTVLDDFSQLDDILGWPDPTQPLSGQTSEYANYTAPAETVVKAAIAANITRLGLPWVVAPSLGRGALVTVDIRFHSLYEKLVPVMKAQRLALTVRRVGAQFMVDVAPGRTFPRPLTLASGIIDSYAWGQKRATRTRAVAGGQGVGTDRAFAQYINTALEVSQGIRESFRDARATEDPAYLPGQAQTLVEEGRPASSVTASLAETSWFSFGKYLLGDLVNVDLGFIAVHDVVSEVEITNTIAAGLTVRPKVGLLATSPDAHVYELLSRLRGMARDHERR